MFGRKKKNQKVKSLLSSFDKMVAKTIGKDDDLLALCDIIISGRALLANFEHLNVEIANRMSHFLSGAVYALDGQVHQIGKSTFLFAQASEYLDGTLKQYIEDVS